jgi:hypothetical protein
MVVKGHFDGKQVVLDEPVPDNVPANVPVTVVFEPVDSESVLDKIGQLARPGGLPRDFAAQHDHYVKGLPKR